MKTYKLAQMGGIVFLSILLTGTQKPDTSDGIAVLELFTSQGCSSCPSADRFLGRLIAEAQDSGQEVYALSFHVSYWNRLGWKDPYSDVSYTERQRTYAKYFGLGNVYTPQMVVNGQYEFVGSSEREVRKFIAQSSAGNAKVEISAQWIDLNQQKLSYVSTGFSTAHVLNIAIVERKVQNYVPRGENRGRNLEHNNVVRSFEQVQIATEGTITIKVPEGLSHTNASIILYAQNVDSGRIDGACKLNLQ